MNKRPPITQLLEIMAKLRNPDGGCPWDVEQDFASIAPYTIEEAYEVADAIARQDMSALKEELGDLLLQVVSHSQMAKEAGHFDFDAVTEAIAQKMIRRHPHVFGGETVATAAAQTEAWEEHKASERKAKGEDESVLDNIPIALPALTRAFKLHKRAARVGFDWEKPEDVFGKLDEEITELKDAMKEEDKAHQKEELGDMLFVLTCLARKLEIDPEEALKGSNRKFEQRFHYIERALAKKGTSPKDASLKEMDALWDEAKKQAG